jgi:c-di-GMP-binding flagellar brake protein YcgR
VEERRKFVRVRGLQEVRYKLKTSGGVPRPVAVKDLSLVGINLYMEEKLDKNTMLELRLDLPDGGQPVFVDGEIIWQIPSHNDRFATGVRFVPLDGGTRDRLSKFILDCAKRVDENREFVRCKLEVDIVYSLSDNPHKKFKGRTMDISRAGMKLQPGEPLENNTRLHLAFTLQHDIDIIEIDAKIVWARTDPDTGLHEAGIIFTKVEDENRSKIDRYIERYCKSRQGREN